MKRKYNSLGLATLACTFLTAAPAHAATILLDDVEARRVTDASPANGAGDKNELAVLDVGNYDVNDRTHPVFVFRMTGKNPLHIVTTTDFTVTQLVRLIRPPSTSRRM